MASKDQAPPEGPRGGVTTRSKDRMMVRKAFLLHVDEEEALRRAAFSERRSEASIVRELIREHFGLDEDDEPCGGAA